MTYYADSSALLQSDDSTFEIIQHDTAPVMRVRLEGVSSEANTDILQPADLTLVTTVTFVMSMAGEVYVRREATPLDQTEHPGELEVEWVTGDTEYIGTYTGEFEVLWLDGTKQTFPGAHTLSIVVLADAG